MAYIHTEGDWKEREKYQQGVLSHEKEQTLCERARKAYILTRQPGGAASGWAGKSEVQATELTLKHQGTRVLTSPSPRQVRRMGIRQRRCNHATRQPPIDGRTTKLAATDCSGLTDVKTNPGWSGWAVAKCCLKPGTERTCIRRLKAADLSTCPDGSKH